MATPEVHVGPSIGALLYAAAKNRSLIDLERAAFSHQPAEFEHESAWLTFRTALHQIWAEHDHLVLRGAPITADGAVTLLLARAFGTSFKTYRGAQIVKHFRMSPWTTELSQTTRDGHFHTDINTMATPPKVTVIHCLEPDPDRAGGPVRVARLEDLLVALRAGGEVETLDFLTNATVKMVNHRSEGAWEGPIVDSGTIRYHPCTLRAANKRYPEQPCFEPFIDVIHRYALEVSVPIVLGRGDAVVVSNTRALHYRGPCTVRFRKFPRDFESREIFVLHLNDELDDVHVAR